jgi:DNA polymerase-4
MVKHFGKVGRFYYKIVRGIDERLVQPERETKSLAAEDTFPTDLTEPDEINRELDKIALTVHNRLLKYSLKGRTLTVKIKYSDFKQITRSKSFPVPIEGLQVLITRSRELLQSSGLENKKIRLLGISLSNFKEPVSKGKRPTQGQLELF